jgi:uncharacterized protein YkwD
MVGQKQDLSGAWTAIIPNAEEFGRTVETVAVGRNSVAYGKLLRSFVLAAAFTFHAAASAQSDARILLDAHNAYRAKHCAPPLTWSTDIAAAAQRWANRCVFDHDRSNELGENLAWGTRLSVREAVSLWYDEVGGYNYAAPGFGSAGHFTQLVWRGSRQVGCGRAVCGADILFVCRYAPAGNFEGEYRQNVSPPCR